MLEVRVRFEEQHVDHGQNWTWTCKVSISSWTSPFHSKLFESSEREHVCLTLILFLRAATVTHRICIKPLSVWYSYGTDKKTQCVTLGSLFWESPSLSQYRGNSLLNKWMIMWVGQVVQVITSWSSSSLSHLLDVKGNYEKGHQMCFNFVVLGLATLCLLTLCSLWSHVRPE